MYLPKKDWTLIYQLFQNSCVHLSMFLFYYLPFILYDLYMCCHFYLWNDTYFKNYFTTLLIWTVLNWPLLLCYWTTGLEATLLTYLLLTWLSQFLLGFLKIHLEFLKLMMYFMPTSVGKDGITIINNHTSSMHCRSWGMKTQKKFF